MSKKLIYLISLVLLLGLAADRANADITTDLIGYWKLDDNANDSSGNGYHGEEYGNPSYVPGIIGQAMEFNGSQSVYIPDFTGIQNQDEVTVCMWVKADRNTGADQVMWFTNEDGSYGRVRFGINGDEWEWKHGGSGSNPNVDDGGNPIILGEWTHLAGVRKNNDRLELFVNAISVETTAFGVAGAARAQGSIGAERRSPTSVRDTFEGTIDEVRVYTRVLSVADIQELFAFTGASPTLASNPDPADEQTDVPRDVVLAWTPGEFAPPINGHIVYLSESFNDVNDGIGGITQSANSYARPQRLDFNTTYYWRVDEVNAPPTSTVYRGGVWSFTTEPVAYAIENITATASSMSEGMGPENTINGSGLDANDLHSTEATDMWLSGDEPNGAWIEYELDKVYKLHEMWVWNSNQALELMFGLGCKDVSIEYSVNGTDYMPLAEVPEFAQASGASDYAHNTTVDFGGAAAKYIRLTANSNWGGIFKQYGLSEVRFFSIPAQAREPSPDSGATDVDVDVTLGFRAGREAAEHHLYLSTDEQAVIDGNAPVTTVAETSHGPLSLDLGETYYWKINEVNDLETPATWQSDLWSFTTHEFFIVDGFEDYNDYPPDEIWFTWVDGYGVPANGATAGYPAPDFLAGENYAETATVHGGDQAMPFFYDNTGTTTYSEGERTFAVPQDWTKAGVQTLVLYFHGSPGNTGQLYVKVNGSKVVYPGNATDITKVRWHPWNIDLASLGVDLQSVTKLAIGIDGNGVSGILYLDDIRLYRLAPEVVVSSEEIWIEAEAADTITDPMLIYDDPLASGGKYIGTSDDVDNSSDSPPPDGIATYNFAVQGGTYKVSGRINILNGNSFWVRIQGAAIPVETELHSSGWVRWNDPPDAANWFWNDVFSDDDDENATVLFTMPAGTYTLEIAYREDGALLDIIVISKID